MAAPLAFSISWPARLLAAVLTAHALLLAWGAFRHSPTFDEAAHLPAGISHWVRGDFELFRVNPPLPRMLAALPVLLLRPNVDWALLNTAPTPGRRLDFEVGNRFIEANGSRSFLYYSVGRLACIPLSLLGAWVCFRWASELYGARAGLLASCLWCFSPNIIAHAQLITPDVPAASCGVLAFYCFWKWLKSPDWSSALMAGIALGLAELTKSTWLLAFVLWPLLYAVHHATARRSAPAKGVTWHQLIVVLVIALYVLNAGYGFSGSFTRLKDYSFVSKALSGPVGSDSSDNIFHGSLWGELPVPLPDQFLLGIDYQKREFEEGAMSYLRGELRRGGWWYYYLFALAVKAPLGVLLLTAVAIATRARFGPRLPGLDDVILLLPFAALLFFVSSQTGINKHLRYILPAFPFAFIWVSQVAGVRNWLTQRAVLCSVAWMIASSLWIYPHSLSYFNELAGGPRHGHRHLINSNIDWGQDLFFLKRLLTEREITHVSLVFWSRYDPRLAGIDFELPPVRDQLELDESGEPANRLRPGVYAISVNHLRGYPFGAPDGRGGRVVTKAHSYSYFMRLQPIATAGYSIYVYAVPEPLDAVLSDLSSAPDVVVAEANP